MPTITDTSVKRISWDMRGAPTLNGQAGTFKALLDTFTQTGWGLVTALSVTVEDGIATATLTPGDTFHPHAVVLIDGATPVLLNGEARVLTSTNTSITWATAAPDGAATGTITIKYAPVSAWQRTHNDGNKAVYRSSHVQALGRYFRIDDSGTTQARIISYEEMTDIDTGVAPMPTEAQYSGGAYLQKSTQANATAVRYWLIADDRFIFLCIAAASGQNAANISCPPRGFGDPIPLSPSGDAWCTVLSCGSTNVNQPFPGSFITSSSLGSNGGMVMARTLNGSGGAIEARGLSEVSSGSPSGDDGFYGPYPSEVDGELKICKMYVKEGSSEKPPRAVVPGIYYIPQSGAGSAFENGDLLDAPAGLAGRKLMGLRAGNSSVWAGSVAGGYLIDITGPWR